jgi:hypothetical protein
LFYRSYRHFLWIDLENGIWIEWILMDSTDFFYLMDKAT